MAYSNNPYLSIIVTSRNDNHGGDMLKRMRIFTKALLYQCNKFNLEAELIFVEWNPIENKAFLIDVLPKSTVNDSLLIRYIRVPKEIHEKHKFHVELPIFQMIAKNVGIRRARSPFVLCTNVDLLFSDKLIEFIASKQLKDDHFYRANRCDIPSSISESMSVEEQLTFSEANIIKRLGKDKKSHVFKNSDGILFKYTLLKPFLPIAAVLKKTILSQEDLLIASLDFDACGDFTLMSKKNWEEISGYVELEMYSLHIDSMAIFSAIAKSKKQVILEQDLCTYHIAHTGGWEITDPIEKLRFFEKFPCLDWWSVWEAGTKIVKEKGHFNINGKSWGLYQYDLEDISCH